MQTIAEDCTLFPYEAGCDHLIHLHSAEFERLNRAIRSGGGFRLLLAQCNLPGFRDVLIDRLKNIHINCKFLFVDRENPSNFEAFQHRLSELATKSDALNLVGMAEWQAVSAEEWLTSLNHRRENLAAQYPIPLVLWLPGRLIKELALQAPDMWAWRAGVFDFTVRSEAIVPKFMTGEDKFLTAPESERRRKRIDGLKTYTESHPDLSPSLRASLFRERGDLQQSLGKIEEAWECFDEALSLYQSIDDEIKTAETRGRMADIYQARRELDEALRIRREESLPVYERLGDVRSILVTRAKIGITLLQKNPPQRVEANILLCQALAAARCMNIPEADTIQQILDTNEMTCENEESPSQAS